MPRWTAVILTGGRSARLGRDKAAARIGGRPLLLRVVQCIPPGIPLVVSGPDPAIDLGRPYTLAREDPPGGGPVAGLAAALPRVDTELLVALATDLPFLGDVPRELALRIGSDDDALIALDATGRAQPLLAAYRTGAVRRAAAGLDEVSGASMRRLLTHLRVAHYSPRTATVDPALDVDTPADLARARGAAMLQDWIDAVRIELGTSGELDVDTVLDVAKDVAHNVQRPAAPLTTYLLGLAVGSGMPLPEAAAKIRELAGGWTGDGR